MPSARLHAVIQALQRTEDRLTVSFKGLTLHSHFQPIYSFTHGRVVGHEALLRARDEADLPTSPLAVFARCADAEELYWCDSVSRAMHITSFAQQRPEDQWLFLNIRPEVITALASEEGGHYIASMSRHLPLPTHHIVLQLLESAIPEQQAFLDALAAFRTQGFLIALDDFGIGHSNFDRIWTIKPDIVKLDRSLVAAMARDRGRQRVVTQMVSLLHECQSLVLMEGVENEEEALLALASDADFVQGYHFGRPAPLLQSCAPSATIHRLHERLAAYRQQEHHSHTALLAPYREALGLAGIMLSTNSPLSEACAAFLELPHAEVCFVLDEQGFQVGGNVWPSTQPDPDPVYGHLSLAAEGACWARRPYFKAALNAPGKVQVTAPYRTLNGNRLSITVSMAFRCSDAQGRDALNVVCADVVWDDHGHGLGPSRTA
jgi:EAL domain-containing protein (putative c-di-GMP-specific phosphodiesterase class I)